jgi:glycerol-3-phosphate O-acyltransferase/dihydroxyacetone phosphate acyltransferase
MRAELSQEIFDVVEELGPTMFDDFESQSALASASADTAQRKAAAGPDVLAHPLSWLDEKCMHSPFFSFIRGVDF